MYFYENTYVFYSITFCFFAQIKQLCRKRICCVIIITAVQDFSQESRMLSFRSYEFKQEVAIDENDSYPVKTYLQ